MRTAPIGLQVACLPAKGYLQMTGGVLWLGGVFAEQAVAENRALSAAANEWSKRFLRSLRAVGIECAVVGHCPSPLFPKGAGFVCSPSMLPIADVQESVDYWNLPVLRRKSLRSRYIAQCRKAIQLWHVPSIVMSYNATPESCFVGNWFRSRYGVPWVPFHLDIQPPGADWCRFPPSARHASAHVFASWAAYQEAPFEMKFFFEGGMICSDALCRRHCPSGEKLFLYAGSAAKAKGLMQLLDAWCSLKVSSKARLAICGPGTDSVAMTQRYSGRRISFLGMLPEREFDELCRRAYCFVNPRCKTSESNRYNFPSKLLRYVSYGRPIISHWTDGLSPEYRDILVIPRGTEPAALAESLEYVLGLEPREYSMKADAVADFAKTRLWERKTLHLMSKLLRIANASKVPKCV